MPQRSYPQFLPFFGLFIVGIGALVYSVSADKVEDFFDTTGIIEARDVTANVGISEGINVWRVRLTESGLLITARSQVDPKHQPGDCVVVRQFSGTNLFERRATIIGTSTGC